MRNGAAAKSGLNKAILASTWGQTKVFLQYKARRQGKLVIEVPAFYSSQECGACGHIHQDNRVSQSEFVCQSCAHLDNADHNAAKVIAKRGVKLLLSGKLVKKRVKRCGIGRKKVGAEGSEPGSQAAHSEVRQFYGAVNAAKTLPERVKLPPAPKAPKAPEPPNGMAAGAADALGAAFGIETPRQRPMKAQAAAMKQWRETCRELRQQDAKAWEVMKARSSAATFAQRRRPDSQRIALAPYAVKTEISNVPKLR